MIDYYRFTVTSDGSFHLVHSVPKDHSSVRIYRGDWRGTLKLEAGRDGGLCILCMFLDAPWGLHPKRKEDATRTSPEEVTDF